MPDVRRNRAGTVNNIDNPDRIDADSVILIPDANRIVDDVIKFLRREVLRNNCYDAILLDPPSFGRGKKGELYKIEEQLVETLDLVHQVLSEDPAFVLLTSHTPGFSPIVLRNLLEQYHDIGRFECGEMLLTGAADVMDLPNGNWARWINK